MAIGQRIPLVATVPTTTLLPAGPVLRDATMVTLSPAVELMIFLFRPKPEVSVLC